MTDDDTRTILHVNRELFNELRFKIMLTSAGLIDDRVPEIELDGITLRITPDA